MKVLTPLKNIFFILTDCTHTNKMNNGTPINYVRY